MSDLLELSAKQILSEFGKGIGMTGSGAVTILSAMGGVQLLVSVCKLTCGKERYRQHHEEVTTIQQKLEEEYLPLLNKIMADELDIVQTMLRNRIKRDKETDAAKKQEYKDLASVHLEQATDSMLTFCKTCLDIIPMALHIYNTGVKSAKGESGVALSNLLSGASSGLFTALLNIKSAKNAAWTGSKRTEVETYFGRLHEYQYIFSGKLAALYNYVQFV